ncbi:hypothetical protein F4803DRAFT_514128 [Xylaria telfairii]|nr:hypothetical protein F4803DRAFT_514128 [Xylaria telfairii]
MATSDDPRVKFGLSCPAGSDFYVCQDSPTQFIGCCGTNPCAPGLAGKCPTPNLFNASYSPASGIKFLPQSCAEPFNSSIWYTCDDARPPFLGCCTNNPCNNGCLPGHLVPATLSKDPANAAQFKFPNSTNSSPSPTATGGEVGDNSSKRIGIIVGSSLAGVVILLSVIGAYLWLKRKEEAQEDLARQSGGFLQGSLFETAPTTNLSTPPVEKSEFVAANSDQPLRNRQVSSIGPSISRNLHSAHVSQLSELEGSWHWNH